MRLTSQTAWALVALLAVALAVRLAGGVWWQNRLPAGQKFFFGDSASYWELGQTIAAGEPYAFRSPEARVFRTPGYPLLLAPLHWLFGGEAPVWAGRALSALLGTAAVGMVYVLARCRLDVRASLLATAIAAVYPGAVSMGVFVLSEAPFCPLMLGQLVCCLRASDAATSKQTLGWAAATGLLGGLATLVRPSWILFTPIAVVALLILLAFRKRSFQLGGLMLAAFVLTMLPWWVRNYQVTGRFVATSLQAGPSLYDGWNPDATGGSDMRFVAELTAKQRELDAADPAPESTFEYRLNQLAGREAVAWARENPGRVLELVGIKFRRMWNVWPNEAEFRSPLLRWIVALTYVPVLLLAAVGAFRMRSETVFLTMCLLPAAYFTLLHVIFVGSLRYREPAMLSILALAAGAFALAPKREPAATSVKLA